MADFEDLINDLKKIEQNNKKAIRETNKKILADALNKVVDKTPVDTGALQQDWNFQIEGDRGLLFNDMEYAPDVEYGHRVGKGKGKSGGKKNNKKSTKKRASRRDGKRRGSVVDGVYMLRDTVNEIKNDMDKYQSFYLTQLGIKDD